MQLKHTIVPDLDIGELLSFGIKKTKNLNEDLQAQEKSKKQLVSFIEKLEKNFKESIYYMGMDIIGEKAYERFLFTKDGFLEVMVEEPVAINAHFVNAARAKKYLLAFKKTLKELLPKKEITEMFINSIQIQNEQDNSLSVEKWNLMKAVRSAE